MLISYSSLVLTHMSYCVERWGNVGKAITGLISILLKRAIRIINKAAYCTHTNKLSWIPVLLNLETLCTWKHQFVLNTKIFLSTNKSYLKSKMVIVI